MSVGGANSYKNTVVDQKYIDRVHYLVDKGYVFLEDHPDAVIRLAFRMQEEDIKSGKVEEYKGIQYI